MDTAQNIIRAARVLGLGGRASLNEIRSAYRRLALKHHPDRTRRGTDRRMAEITAAYETVMQYCQQYEIPFEAGNIRFSECEWWFRHFGENM